MAIPDSAMNETNDTRQPAKKSPPRTHSVTSKQIQAMLILVLVLMLLLLIIVRLTGPTLGQLRTEVDVMVILAKSFNTIFVGLEPQRP